MGDARSFAVQKHRRDVAARLAKETQPGQLLVPDAVRGCREHEPQDRPRPSLARARKAAGDRRERVRLFAHGITLGWSSTRACSPRTRSSSRPPPASGSSDPPRAARRSRAHRGHRRRRRPRSPPAVRRKYSARTWARRRAGTNGTRVVRVEEEWSRSSLEGVHIFHSFICLSSWPPLPRWPMTSHSSGQ